MIVPTKHIPSERALLSLGARILKSLATPRTVSYLWDEIRRSQEGRLARPISYNWFVLALDLLFALGAIQFEDGLIARVAS